LGGKMVELLKEIAPEIRHAAVMLNRDQPPLIAMWHTVEAIAPSLGVRLTQVNVRAAEDIEGAIETAAREPNGGLVVLPSAITLVHRAQITALATRHGVPAIYGFRYFVTSGGLLSYGTDIVEAFRRAPSYIDCILKGAKPADLPVQQPTKFELVINVKTAKALGLTVPDKLLAIADEVIE
jgi:putative tryptophan/tyrosine transport system substrate-binding protein